VVVDVEIDMPEIDGDAATVMPVTEGTAVRMDGWARGVAFGVVIGASKSTAKCAIGVAAIGPGIDDVIGSAVMVGGIGVVIGPAVRVGGTGVVTGSAVMVGGIGVVIGSAVMVGGIGVVIGPAVIVGGIGVVIGSAVIVGGTGVPMGPAVIVGGTGVPMGPAVTVGGIGVVIGSAVMVGGIGVPMGPAVIVGGIDVVVIGSAVMVGGIDVVIGSAVTVGGIDVPMGVALTGGVTGESASENGVLDDATGAAWDPGCVVDVVLVVWVGSNSPAVDVDEVLVDASRPVSIANPVIAVVLLFDCGRNGTLCSGAIGIGRAAGITSAGSTDVSPVCDLAWSSVPVSRSEEPSPDFA